MSRGINRVILIGRLGNDPDVRYTASGSAITTVSLATSEKWNDKQGQPQSRTEWHRVIFFGKLAEVAGKYLKKGSQVYVEGSIRTSKYTDKNGIERYSTDINANEMQMLGSANGGRVNAQNPNGQHVDDQSMNGDCPKKDPWGVPAGGFDEEDDDIPF